MANTITFDDRYKKTLKHLSKDVIDESFGFLDRFSEVSDPAKFGSCENIVNYYPLVSYRLNLEYRFIALILDKNPVAWAVYFFGLYHHKKAYEPRILKAAKKRI